jgi:type IV secretory pathway TrbD component/predicted RNA-binding Zn-ribbon protein involved in translation (DUF1610 family)
MRCRTCEYELWNIGSRRCPECGNGFAPSQYRFAAGTVEFRCPHCGQGYYGTGQDGHLEPAEFACANCGQQVTMDEMVLHPVEGTDPEAGIMQDLPWLTRQRIGTMRGWLRTVGAALVKPVEVMVITRNHRSAGNAWSFAAFTQLITYTVAIIPFLLFSLVGMISAMNAARTAGGGPGGVGMLFGAACGMVAPVLIMLLISLVGLFLWGVATHALLRLGGETEGGVGRTYEALGYSSGANITSAVPCLGIYLGWIWWVVSATIMIKEGQRVGAWRAAFATLTPPLAGLAGLFGLYIWLMSTAMAGFSTAGMGANTSPMLAGGQGTGPAGSNIVLQYAQNHNGQGPDHALRLLVDGACEGFDYCSVWTDTYEANVPVGDITLPEFAKLTREEQTRRLDDLVAGWPDNVVAHRVGDYVYTYHGMELTEGVPDPALVVVLETLDPDANRGNPTSFDVTVVQADGSTQVILAANFTTWLTEQNAVRQKSGLPALPDVRQVRHGSPAVAVKP